MSTEPPFHNGWTLYVVLSTLKGWIEASKKVIKMCSDDTHPFLHCSRIACKYKCQSQHGPWEELDRYLNDDEGDFFASIVFCIGICQGENES